jgi:hypothetical protein
LVRVTADANESLIFVYNVDGSGLFVAYLVEKDGLRPYKRVLAAGNLSNPQ